MKQGDFFYIMQDGVQGSVTQESDNLWSATIAGGWWFAYGKTREDAIRRVIKRYNNEMEKC